VTEAWALAADVFVRGLDAEILTSGRTAAAFGQGFFVDEDTGAVGSMVEATHRAARSTLTLGAEWSDGRVDARGWFTSPPDFTTLDPNPTSDNRSDRRSVALFVRESFSPVPAWTLQVGLRGDRDRTEYSDFMTSDQDSLSFSDVTGRLGAVWNPTPSAGLFASYSESFLPPTPEQLFAFTGFGSNPLLEPERSHSWEIGWRQRFGTALDLTAAAFLLDTQDEIVFDPDPVPGNPFGENVNAGETRREGLEVAARGRAGVRASWFARGTWADATFRNGAAEGNNVPLVPGYRLAAGFDLALWKALQLHLDALRVGSQVLDNDAANEARELPAYTVVNANLRWQVHPKVALFVEGRNLFDERYATRGIYAFDFTTLSNEVFVTPAPDRRFFGGATLIF
jgi:iron complex outermembrane receptor protein